MTARCRAVLAALSLAGAALAQPLDIAARPGVQAELEGFRAEANRGDWFAVLDRFDPAYAWDQLAVLNTRGRRPVGEVHRQFLAEALRLPRDLPLGAIRVTGFSDLRAIAGGPGGLAEVTVHLQTKAGPIEGWLGIDLTTGAFWAGSG